MTIQCHDTHDYAVPLHTWLCSAITHDYTVPWHMTIQCHYTQDCSVNLHHCENLTTHRFKTWKLAGIYCLVHSALNCINPSWPPKHQRNQIQASTQQVVMTLWHQSRPEPERLTAGANYVPAIWRHRKNRTMCYEHRLWTRVLRNP
jgi:hypothetical protein